LISTLTFSHRKLRRQQAEVIQNHENVYVCGIGKVKPDMVGVGGLNLAAVGLTTIQVLLL
jgi:hypothetical protein